MGREGLACMGMTPPHFTSALPGWRERHGRQKLIGALLIAAGLVFSGLRW